MRKRAGGTVTNAIIGVLIIYLCASAAYFYIRGLDGGASSATTASSISSSIRTTSVMANTSITSVQVPDNFSLAQLQTVSFANSSKCDGLMDAKYWDTAIRTSGNTTAHLIPNTVYGLTQSWNGWTDNFRINMSNPPPWLPSGLANYTSSLEAQLAAKVMGTNNVTRAAAVMKNYTSYLGAFEATGVDLLSWGGLSAVKVYYQTGDFRQAVAQTFPAQLDQLFKLSQDCSYSEQQRAQFLGTALSMTALVLATSGKDGFGPQFQDLLTKMGIQDAWKGVKGSLKTINDASPAAAYQTTMVLAALAKKFPTNFNDLGSFTASRIAIMVQALKDKGLSPDEIAQKVAQLSQAVTESDDEGHVAEVADTISYQQEGFLRVKIDSNLQAKLSTPGIASRSLTASLLAGILPGFKPGEVTAFKVTVHKLWMKLPSYHVYQGGTYVEFALPKGEVQLGDEVGLSFDLLPSEDFAKSIPDFTLSNAADLPWLENAAVLKNFRVVDGVMRFDLVQGNHWSSVGSYTLEGQVVKYPGLNNQLGAVYADVAIKDYAGRLRDLRIRYDGFTSASLAIGQGDQFYSVSTMSYDGFRLSIVFNNFDTIATIYTKSPSESIYKLGTSNPYSGSYLKLLEGKYTNAYQVDSVGTVRELEKSMVAYGSTYVLGRIGAEIAYVVGDKILALKNLILQEPSQGGRDVYTLDNTVAIQSRLLTDFPKDGRDAAIQQAVFDLAEALQQDYKDQPQMRDGFAIVSYLDSDGTLKAIIVEVPRW